MNLVKTYRNLEFSLTIVAIFKQPKEHFQAIIPYHIYHYSLFYQNIYEISRITSQMSCLSGRMFFLNTQQISQRVFKFIVFLEIVKRNTERILIITPID